jgi:hypothetical protein
MCKLTTPQTRVLRNIQDRRVPSFGYPLGVGPRSGIWQVLCSLDRRGLIVKVRGQWVAAERKVG